MEPERQLEYNSYNKQVGSKGVDSMYGVEYADNNNREEVPRDISHIAFTSLTCLQLERNEISSVESLCRTWLPLVATVSVGQNYVTAVRCMRKAPWPFLLTLELFDNKIRDTSSLAQAFLPALIHCRPYDIFQKIGRDTFLQPNFPAKLQAKKLKSLWDSIAQVHGAPTGQASLSTKMVEHQPLILDISPYFIKVSVDILVTKSLFMRLQVQNALIDKGCGFAQRTLSRSGGQLKFVRGSRRGDHPTFQSS